MEKATFGAGCFWGVEVAFANIEGVTATAVGYEGGKTHAPTYKDVCTDSTGHAEVVELEFDPTRVTYGQILDAFFALHDPTQLNRQGPDWGPSIVPRSSITLKSRRLRRGQDRRIKREWPLRSQKIATKIEPAQTFWRAEDYHQRYLEKRGLASCHI